MFRSSGCAASRSTCHTPRLSVFRSRICDPCCKSNKGDAGIEWSSTPSNSPSTSSIIIKTKCIHFSCPVWNYGDLQVRSHNAEFEIGIFPRNRALYQSRSISPEIRGVIFIAWEDDLQGCSRLSAQRSRSLTSASPLFVPPDGLIPVQTAREQAFRGEPNACKTGPRDLDSFPCPIADPNPSPILSCVVFDTALQCT
jgi:hypothetical protein